MSTLVRTLSDLVAPAGTGAELPGLLLPEPDPPHAARSADAAGSESPSAAALRRNCARLTRPPATSSIRASMPGSRAMLRLLSPARRLDGFRSDAANGHDVHGASQPLCTVRTAVARWYSPAGVDFKTAQTRQLSGGYSPGRSSWTPMLRPSRTSLRPSRCSTASV